MADLLRRPFGTHGEVHRITPESAGWRYVGFALHRLRAGERVAEATARTVARVETPPLHARVIVDVPEDSPWA